MPSFSSSLISGIADRPNPMIKTSVEVILPSEFSQSVDAVASFIGRMVPAPERYETEILQMNPEPA
jgi:hypothetical protein